MRIDKWLWAARFFKTRSLAVEQIQKGRVKVNGQEAKPSRELKVGDTVELRHPLSTVTLRVLGLSQMRGPAPVARLLYEETPESLALRASALEQRHYAKEPALNIAHGRPTKRNRRDLDAQSQSGGDDRDPPDWDDRWSAAID